MMNDMFMDSNMSDLTSASNEVTENNNGNRVAAIPPKKKKRTPGNPDPEGEIIALSPNTLMTTNRFTCDVCKKGFRREQNLQLHRRGHNLPWKLKLRTTRETKKKYYVCPEITCVHHDPSRALGDLTGVKKHYCRKHGEKKWRCEKCSKRYAVQSDCKAHFKLCGTREYKCDCGTLFSRKDSFLTHRAFCDTLAQERGRTVESLSNASEAVGSSTSFLNYEAQLIHNHGVQEFQQKISEHGIPPWLVAGPTSTTTLSSQLFTTREIDQSIIHMDSTNRTPNLKASSHMSATGLLQKAAEMGVTMSRDTCLSPHQPHDHMTTDQTLFKSTSLGSSTCGSGLDFFSREEIGGTGSFINHSLAYYGGIMEPMSASTETVDAGNSSFFSNTLQTSTTNTNGFERSFFDDTFNISQSAGVYPSGNGRGGTGGSGGSGGGDGMTRDFLGLTAFPHGYGGLEQMGSLYDHQNGNQPPW